MTTTYTLYTIGYQGLDRERLVGWMRGCGEREGWPLLLDIRFRPWSRDPDWRADSLFRRLTLMYEGLPELGNEWYKSSHGRVRLHKPAVGLAKLAAKLDWQPVILLCSCVSWETCHRAVVVERLVKQRPQTPVVHLRHADLPPPPSDALRRVIEAPREALDLFEATHPPHAEGGRDDG